VGTAEEVLAAVRVEGAAAVETAEAVMGAEGTAEDAAHESSHGRAE
jgi:hypothetical protein